MSDVKTFACEFPGCRFVAIADRMTNTDSREAADRRRRILCGQHGYEARKRGLRVYRLTDTLERDAVREANRLEANVFFRAFKAAETKASRNGHSPHSESVLPSPKIEEVTV